jgi:hypothetical protein
MMTPLARTMSRYLPTPERDELDGKVLTNKTSRITVTFSTQKV